MKTKVLIMAAGEGKRMKSELPKILHTLCGKPMVEWVLDAARAVDAQPVLIVGHGRERVMTSVQGVDFAIQEQQLGSGHAVMMARSHIMPDDMVVVLAGDMPLLTGDTLTALADMTRQHDYAATVLTAVMPDATGYGRIVRGENGMISHIVEHRDATLQQRDICEINTSVYCFKGDSLLHGLDHLSNQNNQHEYYLTDVIGMLVAGGQQIGSLTCKAEEAMGVNDRAQLAAAAAFMRTRIHVRLMADGVTIIDPMQTYIDADVRIGQDTVIYPGNVLEKGTCIGKRCTLYPGSRMSASAIGDDVTIQSSVVLESHIGDGSTIGPFAYLRPGSRIGQHCRIGDFVEIKNSMIDDHSKVSHLTYIGDGDVGKDVNVGCGVVFVNYDGYKKHRTTIEDGAFIGCNVNLVSPVRVGKGAYVAAGSTVTENVPGEALCIARARQVNKDGWAANRNKKG